MSRGSQHSRLLTHGLYALLTTTLLTARPGVAAAQDPGTLQFASSVDDATVKLSRDLSLLPPTTNSFSSQMVDVVVAVESTSSLDDGIAQRAGAIRRQQYASLPYQSLRVPKSALQKLASDPLVHYVTADAVVTGASQPARQAARVPGSSVYLNTPNAAYRGAGVTVAVIDTGVSDHPDFYARVGQFDFLNGAAGVPMAFTDGFGHGSHVAGMIGGTGLQSTSAKYQGAATEAGIVSLRVLDAQGKGHLSDVLAALDWILTVGKAQFDIRVVNLSLGKGVQEAQALDPLVQAVNAVWDAGVVVVVSAGNHGDSGHYTVTSPGNSRKVITVGSVTDQGSGTNLNDDKVSSFSSRGPTLFDKVLKPDLVAPGNKIVAPFAPGATLATLLPPSRVFCGTGGTCSWRYLQLSGTSMAAGVVSGAVARMIDKDPSLTPATVKARLMRTARKMSGDPTAIGAGALDVESAMNATGVLNGQALSPLMKLSSNGQIAYVQDTAQLWGGSSWSAGNLWAQGYLWTDASLLGSAGYLWSNAYLWTNANLWADAYLWTNGFLWTEAVAPASIGVEDVDAPEVQE
ncbi:MAG: S8 family peptidase [Vicinamibacteria bacterium]